MTEDPVWFVHERFEELRALLEAWGWLISERGDLSEWDEGRREDPVMGVVRLRGTRDLGDLGRASFTIKEWWAYPPADGPIERHGFVLAGYHYTAVSLRRMVRHCFDPVRHPGEEFHLHPDGDAERQAHGFIAAEGALRALEQRIAQELYDLAGEPLQEVDEDTIDEVFGEGDG
jgi:hypothetical protein